MINIVTISSKGQIVIPKRIREETNLEEKDSVLIFSDNNRIIIEKISKESARKNLRSLLETIGERAKKISINEIEIAKEVKLSRHGAN